MAIDAIINQRDSGIKCVYVAIGQKASTISNVVRKLEEHGALSNTIVVVATASESAALQYWHHMPVAQWANTSVTAVKMR